MIQGKYDYGDLVYIDSKYTHSEGDVIYHELTHHAITQGSLYGVLEIVLKHISVWYGENISQSLAELSNASLTTQEMTAIYAQGIYYKLSGEGKLQTFERRLHESDYYKKYCISGFDEILHYKQNDRDVNSLLTVIAVMALSIDFTLAEPNWKNPLQIRNLIINNQMQYHVDYRYRCLVKSALQLIKQGESLTEKKILQVSGITCLERSYDNVTAMLQRLTKQLSAQYGIDVIELQNKINDVLVSKEQFSAKPNFGQKVLPALLNYEFTFPPSSIKVCDSQMHTVTIALHNESFIAHGIGSESDKVDCLIFHNVVIGWRYPVLYKRTKTISFLSEFNREIIVNLEEYDEFKRDIPISPGRRIFYRYDGKWGDFVSKIRSKSTPFVHLHEATPLVYCVFVINEDKEVFFTLQLKNVITYILEDISKGKMIYANMPENNQKIKDCFYLTETDWCRYDDVVATAINRTFTDFSDNKFPTIGRRINLEIS